MLAEQRLVSRDFLRVQVVQVSHTETENVCKGEEEEEMKKKVQCELGGEVSAESRAVLV